MSKLLYVIARNRPDVHDTLSREFSNQELIQILTDRRFAQRRQQEAPCPAERRGNERRTRADVEPEIRSTGWAKVRLE